MKIKIRGKILYHWVIVGKNGETLATSETYFSKSNAKRAAYLIGQAFKLPIEL